MATVDLDECYNVIYHLMEDAANKLFLRNKSRKEFVCKQGDIDLVTETDKEIENLLINGIKAKFPDHKFIGEETISAGDGPAKLTNEPTWIIDPVDGTMNFVHSFPHFCISVGFVYNKVTEIGMVYNPISNDWFHARRGKGAFRNEHHLETSGQKELSKALITTEFGTTRDPEKLKVVHENFSMLTAKAHGIRVLGSAALNMCMVAMGAADANYEFGIHSWDICAAELIVREAGGIVIDPCGGPLDLMSRRVLAAATPELAKELITNLKQFYPLPRDD